MIRFSLQCSQNHVFQSWFQSGDAYEALHARGLVSCPVCGDLAVQKSLMAPALAPKARRAAAAAETGAGAGTAAGAGAAGAAGAKPDLRTPQTEMETAFAEMRRNVEANSDYVGVNFVAEARRMHEGGVPERSIWGEARPEEVKGLLEDGVRIAPLPFMPSRKTN